MQTPNRFAPSAPGPAGGLLRRDFALPFDLRTVLAVVAMALCWLTPNHYRPWLSFDAEFAMAVVVALLAASAWAAGRQPWRLPAPTLVLLGVALVPPLQHAFGLVHYAGDAWMHAAVLLGLAGAIALGAELERQRAGLVADAVLGAALCASIASVGIQLWQWLQLEGFSDLDGPGLWLLNLPAGARPSANLGQPNHLATLLLWGLVGLWRAFLRRRVGGAVALLAAAFLLFGMAMTQSRSGWVGLLVLACAAWAWRRPLGTRSHRAALAGLLAGFVCLTLAWSSINEALQLSAPHTLENRLSAGARWPNWQVCLAAIAQHPWAGFGWGQVAAAQQSALLLRPASGEYFIYAHSIVLDLLLWNGVPLGALLIAASAAWLVRRFRRVASAEAALLAMAVGTFLLHALLEFPHAYAYFLLPLGLMLGALGSLTAARAPVAAPRPALALVLGLAVAWLGWLAHDYHQASESLQRVRFENARIVSGSPGRAALPEIRMLTQLAEHFAMLRVDVRAPVDAATLAALRRTSERYASDSTIFRYALAAALNGRPGEATAALARLCRLHGADDCRDVSEAWAREAGSRPAATGAAMRAALEEARRLAHAGAGSR